MTLKPELFDRITSAEETTGSAERKIVPTINEHGPDNFELVLQSIGFPFSPSRTFTYATRELADAALAGESQRFFTHLVGYVDR